MEKQPRSYNKILASCKSCNRDLELQLNDITLYSDNNRSFISFCCTYDDCPGAELVNGNLYPAITEQDVDSEQAAQLRDVGVRK